MELRKENRLKIKYIFIFNPKFEEDYLRLVNGQFSVDDLMYLDMLEWPEGWDVEIKAARSVAVGSWYQIKLIDLNEIGDKSEIKYTWLVKYNKAFEKNVLEFFKYLEIDRHYKIVRGS
jgi:hypothetical protein